METKVKITMEGETLRDLKIFLGDNETEVTHITTRAEIILDTQNNKPILNLTLMPRELELPENIIAAMNVERIHLLKPSERFARWRASRGKAIRGAWRRFVDRLPRKAPTIRMTRPAAFVAPTVEPSEDDLPRQPGLPSGEYGTYTGPMTDTPTEVALEVQAEREQRSAQAVAHERELDIIKEQYDLAGKNLGEVAGNYAKRLLNRLTGNKK